MSYDTRLVLSNTDLGRMYQLVSRITDGLGELKNLLESHITHQGLTAIEKCGEAATNVSLQARWMDINRHSCLGNSTVYVSHA